MVPQRIFALASWLAAVVFGMSIAGIGAPASAQSNQSLGNLYVGDYTIPTPEGARRFLEAARAARAAGECPRAKFTVIVKKGDPLFQENLAKARRQPLLQLLGDRGRYFLFDIDWEGAADEVKVEYDVARDQEFPKLDVVWDPPPGKKVGPGTKIMARAAASDDWNLWQSGVRRIDMNVLPESSNQSFGFQEWPPHPRTCENMPPTRRLEGVYTVPPSPPPVVRLRVRAVDHAGHANPYRHIAEYPTGDWAGTFQMESAGRLFTRADIVLNHDGRGNLTGTMVGQQRIDYTWNGGRCFQRTIRPNRFRVSLVGTYTEGRAFKVFIKEVEESKLREERGCAGSGSVQMEFGFKTHIWGAEALLGTPSPLGEGEVRADGTRYYKFEHPPTTATVTLRPAR